MTWGGEARTPQKDAFGRRLIGQDAAPNLYRCPAEMYSGAAGSRHLTAKQNAILAQVFGLSVAPRRTWIVASQSRRAWRLAATHPDGKTCASIASNLRHALGRQNLKRLQTTIFDLYQLHWPESQHQLFGKAGLQHEDPDGTDHPGGRNTLEVLDEMVKGRQDPPHSGYPIETPLGCQPAFLHLAESPRLGRRHCVHSEPLYPPQSASYETVWRRNVPCVSSWLAATRALAFGN